MKNLIYVVKSEDHSLNEYLDDLKLRYGDCVYAVIDIPLKIADKEQVAFIEVIMELISKGEEINFLGGFATVLLGVANLTSNPDRKFTKRFYNQPSPS